MDYRMLIPQMWHRHQEEQWRAAVKVAMINRPGPPPPPYYRNLLTLADMLITEGRQELRHELAVIVSQIACEVLIEQTLTPLLAGQKAPWNFNVGSKKVRNLYIKLTHDAIDTASFWTRFEAHVVRRHEVVHRGQRVSATEAQESLTAATDFVGHVEGVRDKLAAIVTATTTP
jgi:hypothetical protein